MYSHPSESGSFIFAGQWYVVLFQGPHTRFLRGHSAYRSRFRLFVLNLIPSMPSFQSLRERVVHVLAADEHISCLVPPLTYHGYFYAGP
jgi:hypothetical protein